MIMYISGRGTTTFQDSIHAIACDGPLHGRTTPRSNRDRTVTYASFAWLPLVFQLIFIPYQLYHVRTTEQQHVWSQ